MRDLDRLEAMAKAATLGPWHWSNGYSLATGSKRHVKNFLGFYEEAGLGDRKKVEANKAFIVACSPDVILALIQRIRDVEAQ